MGRISVLRARLVARTSAARLAEMPEHQVGGMRVERHVPSLASPVTSFQPLAFNSHATEGARSLVRLPSLRYAPKQEVRPWMSTPQFGNSLLTC